MRKHKKWGIATLMLLLGIATVFLLINTDTPPDPKLVLGQVTKDQLKQGVKLPADNPRGTSTPDAANRQPPPGASANGHWDGNEWHNEPHDISDGQSVSAEPILAPFYPTSDIQPDNWHSELKKARDEWLQARETAHNFRKGKWTPEHIQALSDTEKQQIASQLRELTGHVETSKKKLDALFEVKKAYKK